MDSDGEPEGAPDAPGYHLAGPELVRGFYELRFATLSEQLRAWACSNALAGGAKTFEAPVQGWGGRACIRALGALCGAAGGFRFRPEPPGPEKRPRAEVAMEPQGGRIARHLADLWAAAAGLPGGLAGGGAPPGEAPPRPVREYFGGELSPALALLVQDFRRRVFLGLGAPPGSPCVVGVRLGGVVPPRALEVDPGGAVLVEALGLICGGLGLPPLEGAPSPGGPPVLRVDPGAFERLFADAVAGVAALDGGWL